MLVIIGRNNDFIGRNNDNVILKERKISDLTLFNMISFEKINFCALIGWWISLKAARSKDSDNFLQGGHRPILFVYLYLVRTNIKTEFCSIWSLNPRIFPYYKSISQFG